VTAETTALLSYRLTETHTIVSSLAGSVRDVPDQDFDPAAFRERGSLIAMFGAAGSLDMDV